MTCKLYSLLVAVYINLYFKQWMKKSAYIYDAERRIEYAFSMIEYF